VLDWRYQPARENPVSVLISLAAIAATEALIISLAIRARRNS
jgi:hypothetical protein